MTPCDAYRDEMDAEHQAVVDRLHQLIVTTYPDAEVVLSYDIRLIGSRGADSTSRPGNSACRCMYHRAGSAVSPRVIRSCPRPRGPSRDATMAYGLGILGSEGLARLGFSKPRTMPSWQRACRSAC